MGRFSFSEKERTAVNQLDEALQCLCMVAYPKAPLSCPPLPVLLADKRSRQTICQKDFSSIAGLIFSSQGPNNNFFITFYFFPMPPLPYSPLFYILKSRQPLPINKGIWSCILPHLCGHSRLFVAWKAEDPVLQPLPALRCVTALMQS